MLEGVPDAISASAYGLGSDRVRGKPSVSYLSTRTQGAGQEGNGNLNFTVAREPGSTICNVQLEREVAPGKFENFDSPAPNSTSPRG